MARMKEQRKLNLSFFDQSSPERDYFLGLWWADGCLRKDSIRIDVTKKDKEHLVGVVNLFCNYGVYDYASASTVRWCVSQKQLANKLRELGGIERKSLVIGWPSWVGSQYGNHFVRGVFDGDGFFCITDGTLIAGFSSGSSGFIDGVREFVLRECGAVGRIERRPPASVKIRGCSASFGISYQLRFCGINAERLGAWMYQGGTGPSLVRKQVIFEKRIARRKELVERREKRHLTRESVRQRVLMLRQSGISWRETIRTLDKEGHKNSQGREWTKAALHFLVRAD